MGNYYSRKLNSPFNEVVDRLWKSLQAEGFEIITSINLTGALKERLNVPFRNYIILSACNPELAYKAITLDSHIGLMLPCNLVVEEHENGEVEITAVNPFEMIDSGQTTFQIKSLEQEVSDRLRQTLDNLRQEKEDFCSYPGRTSVTRLEEV